jgi:lipoic acid synthetase
VAEAAARLGLRYVVLTAVARDDLADGGARWFAATLEAVRQRLPGAQLEVLTPDFRADPEAIRVVLSGRPDVFNHNIETVPRLFPDVRPQGRYAWGLEVLREVKRQRPDQITKSGLMVGLGETDAEIEAVLLDLRRAGVDVVTLGQYLRPTRQHLPVARYVPPGGFEVLAGLARRLGFPTVHSGVFVRSSFNAEEVYRGAAPGVLPAHH